VPATTRGTQQAAEEEAHALEGVLEPVRIATHLNSWLSPWLWSSGVSGTTVLMALLALILLRSLAMPLIAWATIT
jgi:hypothetical protein